MDQTTFSLLVGLLIGVPACSALLRAFTSMPLWVTIPIAFVAGTLPVAVMVYGAIEALGRLSDRSRNPHDKD